ncbi:class II fructose-1,6-bisphosphate aldolase [Salisediminibacterium selenitireducens]|uniref:Fructose-1,6-bisphosphate aldolase, class II n=1 Tax=Bacillus selenitireducens (strain ATCC 700615 / DSM 15326 / MLS10) TaxID=439292 RepID=D6Y0U5_BACIE|nr:class II fructose-1,6-bisphosphate aldolase [Salisediminibacterium selenitireducens]ADI00663.1 fructose-1,6-bisphosphate aldolase, class II [[Bacillus] selenitireducens MLS10]
MPLVSMTDMLNKAFQNQYAVGQFNINNLEWTQAILQAAEEEQSPVILGVSEGAAKYMGGFKLITAMVKELMESQGTTVPVAIHLDHGQSIENCKKAVDAGFTSVMIDGSHHPIEENIEMTKAVVEYAHARGASVEAEVGTVGGEEDGVIGGVNYADLEECVRITKEGKADALAAALGSVHGPYQGEPKLGFKEMEEIANATKTPLVLHGGSGIPTHQVKKAIEFGHAKINVNTECQIEWTKAVREKLANDEKVYDPRKVIGPGKEAIVRVVKDKMQEFGSSNQA